MLNLNELNIRTFDVKLKSGEILHINPPKVKVLRKTQDLLKKSDKDIELIVDATVMVLNSNSKKKVFDRKYVEENFDVNDIVKVLQGYLSWVAQIQKNPN